LSDVSDQRTPHLTLTPGQPGGSEAGRIRRLDRLILAEIPCRDVRRHACILQRPFAITGD
jgi:hypothetical protein